jgi:glycosyltransferase involved in cell wall biosynthesis
MFSTNRKSVPSYAFLLPWPFEGEGGGVNHAIFGLVNQCLLEGRYRPVALETNWAFERPETDECRGITRVRFRLRTPWSDRTPLRTAISYLCHLPMDIYRLSKLVKELNLQIINTQPPDIASLTFVAMRWLRLFRGKNVITFQGSDVRIVLRTRGPLRWFWRAMLRGADRLVFVSEDLKNEFLAFDPKLARRSVVVYNGVDIEGFVRQASRDVSLPPVFRGSGPVVVSIGGFEFRKGHDLLIHAFQSVLKERPDVRLAIVGRTGPTLNELKAMIQERGLESNIALLPDVPYADVPSLLRRADVFVLSSRWRKGEFGEGFPLVLAESGALGRPVVSTQSTGCEEIIRDGETGRLVATEDSAAIARAILDMLVDRDAAQRMGANLQKKVREQFTWRHAWIKYRDLVQADAKV